jgi:hypothetical protein
MEGGRADRGAKKYPHQWSKVVGEEKVLFSKASGYRIYNRQDECT